MPAELRTELKRLRSMLRERQRAIENRYLLGLFGSCWAGGAVGYVVFWSGSELLAGVPMPDFPLHLTSRLIAIGCGVSSGVVVLGVCVMTISRWRRQRLRALADDYLMRRSLARLRASLKDR